MSTVRVRTSELTGAALDWAVMKCEHPDNSVDYFKKLRAAHPLHQAFFYSTDWAQAGPIIEREKTNVGCLQADGSLWVADEYSEPFCGGDKVRCFGPTPLIAAMRCYVASRMGAEVEIPEELT